MLLQPNTKKMAYLAIIFFILTLIPIIVVFFYSYPRQDDFYYGIKTVHAVRETGSIIETLKAAGAQVAETYQDWQGSFSAVFLFALHPGIWGEQYYVITGFVMMGLFILGSLLLWKTVLVDCLHASKYSYILVAFMTMWCSIQYLPSPVQGFFWWNGAAYYTLFYSLSLILYTFVIKLIKSPTFGKALLWSIPAILLTAVVSGGNYVTVLLTTLLLIVALVYLCIKKDKKAFLVGAILAVMLAGFFISLFAPGNGVRMEDASRWHTPSFIGAIKNAIKYGFYYMKEWITLPTLVLIVLLWMVLYPVARTSKFSFKLPMLFTLFTFLLFCAQFAPTCYGEGGRGNDRLLNIIFHAFFWFLSANIFYYCGYIHKKLEKRNALIVEEHVSEFTSRKQGVVILALVIALLIPFVQDSDAEWYINSQSTTASAIYSIRTGELQKLRVELDERTAIMNDDSIKEVYVKNFNSKPYLLSYGALETDPSYKCSNYPMAQYYDKDFIIALPD